MKKYNYYFILAVLFIILIGMLFQLNASKRIEVKDQGVNFNDDLNKASIYWKHNKLGSAYFRSGQYDKAINEYQIAIEIVENSPGENWSDVSKDEMDRINRESQVSDQIFSRYGLVEALEKAGRYDEAIQNVDWLMQNQIMRGKEEFLKNKLEGMKKDLLQKKLQNKQ